MNRTKANIPAPPPRNRAKRVDATSEAPGKPSPIGRKVAFATALEVDQDADTSDNMGQGKSKLDLNFLVPVDFHQRFKMEAVKRGMKMKDMLYVMFEQWVHDHPAGTDRQLKRAERPQQLDVFKDRT